MCIHMIRTVQSQSEQFWQILCVHSIYVLHNFILACIYANYLFHLLMQSSEYRINTVKSITLLRELFKNINNGIFSPYLFHQVCLLLTLGLDLCQDKKKIRNFKKFLDLQHHCKEYFMHFMSCFCKTLWKISYILNCIQFKRIQIISVA